MTLLFDIWQSFRRLPGWVQVWISFILVPVNLAPVIFYDHPYGIWISILAVGGMAPNLIVMAIERGFGKLMALPHLILWTPLVVLIAWLLWASGLTLDGDYLLLLYILLAVDVISLGFDIPDFLKWLRGERGAV